jgi:dTDP-4-dehydrorhamnose reductase
MEGRMTRILLFGANGQLGFRLQQLLGDSCVALDRSQADLATLGPREALALMETHSPDIIINAAAYTAVDKAESERALASRINGEVPGMLAAAAGNTPFIHFSTDYVFDGKSGAPYGQKARPTPLNHYGASKLQGEDAIRAAGGNYFIFRLQWLYDTRGNNFLCTMKRLLQEKTQLTIVADQRGAPSAALDIASAVVNILPLIRAGTLKPGLYHLSAAGDTSWHGFACAIADALGSSTSILPITTEEYPTAALRPRDTRLDCSNLAKHGITMPHWRVGLRDLMEGSDAHS